MPSAVARVAIRGSISDNTHERFAAPHGEDNAAEVPSSGTVSHVVLVCVHHFKCLISYLAPYLVSPL